jgi:hypothetical protein
MQVHDTQPRTRANTHYHTHGLTPRLFSRADIPVRGYIHWTVTDNWEWADGYCPKFGLVSVDRSLPSMPRMPRLSYWLYKDIVQSRRVSWRQKEEAWANVTRAAASNQTHDVCRVGVLALDTPMQARILAGTEDPNGNPIDWRFNESHIRNDAEAARRASTLLVRGNARAPFSRPLLAPPPTLPPALPPALLPIPTSPPLCSLPPSL